MVRMSHGDIEVVFKPIETRAVSTSNKVLLDVARECGIPVRADCGGIGVCGKCRVRFETIDGELSKPTQSELNILGEKSIAEGYRLACQVKLISGRFIIYIPSESIIQKYRSADIGLEKPLVLKPAINIYRVRPSKPTLNHPYPDLDRVVEEIKKALAVDEVGIPLEILRELPEILRKADWDIDVVLWSGKKIVDVRPHIDSFKPYGLAIDIGTSRVVVHLVDLLSGETIAIESMVNPQTVYGADIISRLVYASRSVENLQKLHTVIVNSINTLIEKIVNRVSISLDQIYEAVVVCNTVMHHLFLGIEPRYLGIAPYTPGARGPLHYEARELGLKMNKYGIVYLPPIIAGFVGSDAVADAVSIDIDECREPCILIDIGTNTEIIVNTGKKIVAGSTPAGPAFEGASMSFGIRAIEGAIDQVYIYFDKSLGDYVVKYSVIGGKKPAGVCGSGYIDLVANLYRVGVLNKRGKFYNDIKSSRIVKENGLTKFIVVRANETSIGKDIAIDERDVDNLLLAKAAIASGLKTLLEWVDLEVNDIGKIYIAGSFGSYINIENAITIGLLPNISISRYVFIGNASITGAKAILKSRDIRDKTVSLSKRIEYVEISAYPNFKKLFTESLYLP